MRHPGFATILEKGSPPMMFNAGDGFHYEKLPEGTRVIYPPGPVDALAEPNVAIERALLQPMGMEPLHELLFPGMKLTIAFDDLSLPLPPMQRPDTRQLVIEKVLEKAYARGVEDIHLIAALGLHRRMTEAELRHCLGNRIMSRFYPERLYNYDAEDPDGNVKIGDTDRGEDVHREPPGRRGRPSGLRQRQLHPHGRRAQIGAHGPRALLVHPPPPHPRHPLAHPIANGPAQTPPCTAPSTGWASSSTRTSRSSTSRRP